jgi:hypothetical protein
MWENTFQVRVYSGCRVARVVGDGGPPRAFAHTFIEERKKERDEELIFLRQDADSRLPRQTLRQGQRAVCSCRWQGVNAIAEFQSDKGGLGYLMQC